MASVVARFAAYRATEAAETAAYVDLAAQASRSTLETIESVERAVLDAAHEASRAPNELASSLMTLSAEVQAFAVSYQDAILPHEAFLATHGAALPDMTSGGLRSLNAMLGYVQQRGARSDATATSLLGGIAMRRQALILLQANETTRAAAARSRLGRASAIFEEEARARAALLAKAPPVSEKLKLPYLAARHDELRALLLLRPLCEASSASWREGGCAALRERFDEARTAIEATLPRQIASGVRTMRERGVDAALLQAVQDKLDAGDGKGAAIAYDAAVRASEGI
jgi:hypothetical protein